MNASRSGSVTLGGKGRTYVNIGIPETGIYSSQRIGKKNSSSFKEETHLMVKLLKRLYLLLMKDLLALTL